MFQMFAIQPSIILQKKDEYSLIKHVQVETPCDHV